MGEIYIRPPDEDDPEPLVPLPFRPEFQELNRQETAREQRELEARQQAARQDAQQRKWLAQQRGETEHSVMDAARAHFAAQDAADAAKARQGKVATVLSGGDRVVPAPTEAKPVADPIAHHRKRVAELKRRRWGWRG